VAIKSQEKRTFNSTLFVILATVVIIAGAGFWFLFLRSTPGGNQQLMLTPEAKAYVGNLGLSEVEMKASENYMKATVVDINGKITNRGERPLKLVEINCVFYDPYGQLVLRERVAIVKRTGASLKTGETRAFRLPFDSIPSSWNQTLPQLVIARIDFEN
jgi:hypothetical protein